MKKPLIQSLKMIKVTNPKFEEDEEATNPETDKDEKATDQIK